MDPMEYPKVRAWAESFGDDVDYVDFLTAHSDLAAWVAVSHVFWPTFTRVRGCTLWSRVYDPQNFETWYRHLDGDPARIEATLNQLKLWQIIECEDTTEDNRALNEVAHAVKYCWLAALQRSFPGERFDVRVVQTEDGPIVSFSAAPSTAERG